MREHPSHDQYHSFGFSPTHYALYKNSACVSTPGLSTSLFLEEFSKLSEYITGNQRHKRLLIVGDFNIHVDNSNDTTKCVDLLDSFNLVQHVSEKTYANEHTLDLVISNAMDHFVNDVKITDPFISDNLAFHSNLHLEKPRFVKKVVS